MIAFVATFQPRDAFVDLVENVLAGEPTAGAEASIITKDTPTGGDSAIYVGTGKACVYADSLDPVTKCRA